MHKKLTALLLTGAALGATVVAAPSAMATSSGGSCVGTLVNSLNLTVGNSGSGSVYGYLNVYWDGSTGENCAMVTSSSLDWGVQKPMRVSMGECEGDTVSTCNPYAVERTDGSGSYPGGSWGPGSGYSYYAGPISVPAAGHCISVGGFIYLNGQFEYATFKGDC
jgi:hypothetical protein